VRSLTHAVAFVVACAAFTLLGTALAFRVWPVAGWAAVVLAAAWLVGWLTVPKLAPVESCPSCAGWCYVPSGDALDVCETCAGTGRAS
jgi:hypothetical protein